MDEEQPWILNFKVLELYLMDAQMMEGNFMPVLLERKLVIGEDALLRVGNDQGHDVLLGLILGLTSVVRAHDGRG